MCAIFHWDSRRITGGGLIFIFALTQFTIHSVSSGNGAGGLQVLSESSTLLHRRSTRASNNVGGRWVPVLPKHRRTVETRYFDQRAMTNVHVPPPFAQHNLQQRPMAFQSQNKLQITRPSQPEGQPYPAKLYGPPSPMPPSMLHPTSPVYLPPTHVPPNQTTGEVLMNNPSESELRFLFHHPEDENLIKSTILEESQRYNERVSFVRGPTLKFQRRQTIYLPPRKKSVIYIMLKEPQVQTDLEVIEPQSDATPEVNIVYEKSGGVRTKHYYSTSDKMVQNGGVSSASGSAHHHQYGHSHSQHHQDLTPSGSEVKNVKVLPVATSPTSTTGSPEPRLLDSHRKRSVPNQVTNPCQPNSTKKLRKRR